MKKVLLCTVTSLMLALNACSPIGVVAGAGTGLGVAATKEGGLDQAAQDTKIRIQINDMWFRHNVDMFSKLNLNVREARVMITGVVQDPQMRIDAVRLAWQADDVKQVINEIRIDESGGLVDYAKDTLIITKLRAKITFDREISSLNYTVDTVNGVVYLMGVAQSDDELQRVIDHARNTSHVQEVVSYVRIKTQETPRQALDPSKGAGELQKPVAYDEVYRVDAEYEKPDER